MSRSDPRFAWRSSMVGRSSVVAAVLAAGCAGSAGTATSPPPSDPPTAPAADPLDLMSIPTEYRERPISRDAGEDYFGEYGMGDPYSAGIAYPVLLALLSLFPEELGGDVAAFTKRFGFIPSDGSPLPVGFHLTTDPFTNVSFAVMNCQVCPLGAYHREGEDPSRSRTGQ